MTIRLSIFVGFNMLVLGCSILPPFQTTKETTEDLVPRLLVESIPEPFNCYGIDLRRLDSTPTQQLADAGEIVIFGKIGGFKERRMGKGQCPLCHKFRPEGVGIRAPNLFGIIERAERRIKEPRNSAESKPSPFDGFDSAIL